MKRGRPAIDKCDASHHKTRGSSTDKQYQKLSSLGKASYVSKSGMATLLKHVEEHGLPEAFSRATQYRARKAECHRQTPYGECIEGHTILLENGVPIDIALANPMAMFYEQCRLSEHFSRIVKDAMVNYPCSPAKPWNIVFYQDGIDPSDGLAKHHSRKSCVFYSSFLEFGQRALAHEEVWSTLCIARENGVAKKLDGGGIGRLTEKVAEQFFNEKRDIRRAGMVATLYDGSRVHIFAVIGCLLADALAFQDMLACKGHDNIIWDFHQLNHVSVESVP